MVRCNDATMKVAVTPNLGCSGLAIGLGKSNQLKQTRKFKFYSERRGESQ